LERIFGVVLLIGSLSASLAASEISGQFTLDGTLTATNTGLIDWNNENSPFASNEATIRSSGLTGSFAGDGGQTVTINSLNSSGQPVGTTFTDYNFIDFLGDPTFPELLANFIPSGTGGSTGCSSSPPASAQTCTPGAPLAAFTFLNLASSFSSATWYISGVTSDGLSSWSAQINMFFDVSYQQVLDNFTSNGSITDTYTAQVTVSEIPVIVGTVPEPATLPLMGSGLVLLAWLGYRKRKRGQQPAEAKTL
jgi:hypothetical protein